jgi:thioester reductase-like protein
VFVENLTKGKMMRIIISGITGAVGAFLAPLLKAQGHDLVCLIRGKNPQARLENILGRPVDGSDIALEGDMTKFNFGLSRQTINSLRNSIDAFIHCASIIKFNGEDVKVVNVSGTRNAICLASVLSGQNGVPIHYIGTAYVAGDSPAFSEQDRNVGQNPRNVYEESKLMAEELVRDSGLNHSIYRPSIIVGHSQTGQISAFSGYYTFFGVFWRLRERLKMDWAKDRQDCLRKGFSFSDEGFLNLPLSIDCSPNSTLNLVPIDWVCRMFALLLEKPAQNRTFHLTHPSPSSFKAIAEHTLLHLNIQGVRLCQTGCPAEYPLLCRIQKMLDGKVKDYLPYINQEACFGTENIRSALGADYQVPLPVDRTFLAKQLDYAVSVRFGY